MANLQCETHEAPELLKREVQALFPNRDLQSGALSVITMVQKTENDMSVWSNEMEDERDVLTEHFFSAAKEVVARYELKFEFIVPKTAETFPLHEGELLKTRETPQMNLLSVSKKREEATTFLFTFQIERGGILGRFHRPQLRDSLLRTAHLHNHV